MRLADTLNGVQQLATFQFKNQNRVIVFRRGKQTVARKIDGKVIETSFDFFRQLDGLNQLEGCGLRPNVASKQRRSCNQNQEQSSHLFSCICKSRLLPDTTFSA